MTDAFGMDGFSQPADAGWPVSEEAKASGFKASQFVRDYAKQTNSVLSAASQQLVDTFVEGSLVLLKKFWFMAKQAVSIAVSKFLVELCAMIISAVGAALLKSQGKPVEITTPNVFFNPSGQAPASQQAQPSLWNQSSGSPFDSGWSSQRSSVGAW